LKRCSKNKCCKQCRYVKLKSWYAMKSGVTPSLSQIHIYGHPIPQTKWFLHNHTTYLERLVGGGVTFVLSELDDDDDVFASPPTSFLLSSFFSLWKHLWLWLKHTIAGIQKIYYKLKRCSKKECCKQCRRNHHYVI